MYFLNYLPLRKDVTDVMSALAVLWSFSWDLRHRIIDDSSLNVIIGNIATIIGNIPDSND